MLTEDNEFGDVARSRLHLANERTFLAWLRTSLVIIGLGFIVSRLGFFTTQLGLENQLPVKEIFVDTLSLWLGIAIILYGVAMTIYALKIYADTDKAIEKAKYTPRRKQVYAAGIGLMFFGVIIISFLFLISG